MIKPIFLSTNCHKIKTIYLNKNECYTIIASIYERLTVFRIISRGYITLSIELQKITSLHSLRPEAYFFNFVTWPFVSLDMPCVFVKI